MAQCCGRAPEAIHLDRKRVHGSRRAHPRSAASWLLSLVRMLNDSGWKCVLVYAVHIRSQEEKDNEER